jgi:predicted GNAT family acetyltransferase
MLGVTAIEHGVFYGIRSSEGFLAAGGTHTVAPAYGMAVLGSIFTHPQARRQGHATTITAALTTHLLQQGCQDVVLNVVADNSAAIQVYTRLGFQTHHHYWTGQAERL